jgi:hypothetical protein
MTMRCGRVGGCLFIRAVSAVMTGVNGDFSVEEGEDSDCGGKGTNDRRELEGIVRRLVRSNE